MTKEDIDLISRQKVLATLDFADKALDEERTVEKYKELLTECIKVLPSAEDKREPKIGRWILTSDDECEYCTCSECGYQNGENWMIGSHIKFCQECGADMRGGE